VWRPQTLGVSSSTIGRAHGCVVPQVCSRSHESVAILVALPVLVDKYKRYWNGAKRKRKRCFCSSIPYTRTELGNVAATVPLPSAEQRGMVKLGSGGLTEVLDRHDVLCCVCGKIMNWKGRVAHARGQKHWKAIVEATAMVNRFAATAGKWAATDVFAENAVSTTAAKQIHGVPWKDGQLQCFDEFKGTLTRPHQPNTTEAAAASWGCGMGDGLGWVERCEDEDDALLVGPAWHFSELATPGWQKRQSGLHLDPSWTLAEMPRHYRLRLWRYLASVLSTEKAPKDWPSLPQILAEADWSLIRVKELFESCEVARLVQRLVAVAEKVRPVTHIYDLACGHGLVGMLLAHRYPTKIILGVDLERRSSFDAVVQRWRDSEAYLAYKQKTADIPGHTAPLDNLEFLEGDAYQQVPAEWMKSGKPEGALVLSVHGCNTATPQAIELAEQNKFVWLVMPCCFDEALYLPTTPVRPSGRPGQASGLRDASRYVFVCGALAANHKAWLVREIDGRITNKNLVIMGGSTWYNTAKESRQDIRSSAAVEATDRSDKTMLDKVMKATRGGALNPFIY